MFRLWKLIFFFALAVPFCLSACVPVSAFGGGAMGVPMSGDGVQEGLALSGESNLVLADDMGSRNSSFVPYVNNMIYVFVDDEVELSDGSFYSEAAFQAAKAVGGNVVGKMPEVQEYQISVEPQDYAELDQMCECLVNGSLDGSSGIDAVDGITGARVDLAFALEGQDFVSGQNIDSFGSPIYNDWPTIIHRDEAWEAMGHKFGVGIGVVDMGFDFTDDNLEIDASDETKEYYTTYDGKYGYHGFATSCMAGSIHTNVFSGCAPKGTLVYASTPEVLESKVAPDMSFVSCSGLMESMMECINRGCRVLNFSFGLPKDSEGVLPIFRDYISAYLCRVWRECGKDFLITQAAGNAWPLDGGGYMTYDVSESLGVFCGLSKEHLERGMSIYMHSKGYQNNIWQYGYMSVSSTKLFRDLRDRIIIVGASDGSAEDRQFLWESSSYGFGVDLYAPGNAILMYDPKGILGTLSGIAGVNGTSYSAPMVAGVASMVWGKYPGLSASSVKDIVVGGTINHLYDLDKKSDDSYTEEELAYMNRYEPFLGSDFVLDAGQAMRYAAEYINALNSADVGGEYVRVYDGNGTDTLRIGSANADSHLLDASSRVLPFSISRKKVMTNLDMRGVGYGLMYPKQTGHDGFSYYRVKKPLSYLESYSDFVSPYCSFLCVRPHAFEDHVSGNVSFKYSFPSEDEMVGCYKLFPAGSLLSDVPKILSSSVPSSGGKLTKELLVQMSVQRMTSFSAN